MNEPPQPAEPRWRPPARRAICVLVPWSFVLAVPVLLVAAFAGVLDINSLGKCFAAVAVAATVLTGVRFYLVPERMNREDEPDTGWITEPFSVARGTGSSVARTDDL